MSVSPVTGMPQISVGVPVSAIAAMRKEMAEHVQKFDGWAVSVAHFAKRLQSAVAEHAMCTLHTSVRAGGPNPQLPMLALAHEAQRIESAKVDLAIEMQGIENCQMRIAELEQGIARAEFIRARTLPTML